MFHLAQEWGKLEKVPPRVRMLPGERRRERVLSWSEEKRYLEEAPLLLHDVATILIDCGLRPEECFRLKWESVRDGSIEIQCGKTDNARRRIPMSNPVAAVLEMRITGARSERVFPAPTRSGHIEPGSVKRQHVHACEGKQNELENTKREYGEPKKWSVEPFPALHPPPYLPDPLGAPHGSLDASLPRRASGYVHHQALHSPAGTEHPGCDRRARSALGGHNSGHTADGRISSDLGNLPVSA